MATIVLGTIGFVVSGGNPIGYAIGAAIGGYIDQQFLFPLVFGEETFQGPRIGDFNLQTASEGSNVNSCYGDETRVSGTVIWFPKIFEKRTTSNVGKGGGGGGNITTFDYFADVAVGICKGPIIRILRVWADGKLIFNVTEDVGERVNSLIKKMRIYNGTNLIFDSEQVSEIVEDLQLPDPVIEATEGAGTVPAWEGLAYMVLEKIELNTFGNRLPTFSFLVEESIDATYGEIFDKIGNSLKTSGISFSSHSSASTKCGGYTYQGPTPLDRALEPLMLAGDLDVREEVGILQAFIRADVVVSKQIQEEDLAAHEENTDHPPQVEFVDMAGFDLPSEVIVNFIEPASTWQRASQRERLIDWVTRTVRTIDVPITMTAGDARNIAQVRLWNAWNERRLATVTLPPSYIGIQEGDIIQLNWKGQGYELRIAERTIGHNFIINIKGVVRGAAVNPESTWEEPPLPPDGVYIAPDMILIIMHAAALRDEDATEPGYYFAASAVKAESQFQGAVLKDSMDNITYSDVQVLPGEATLGQAMPGQILGDAVYGVWDEFNTIDVEMFNGELESVGQFNLLNGSNRMFIANELIGFQFAELIGENQETTAKRYRLSRLLRGQRDTDLLMATHVEDEFVIFAAPNEGVGFEPHSISQVGFEPFYWKCPSSGQDIDDAATVVGTFKAQTMVPFKPTHLLGTRNYDFDGITLMGTVVTDIIKIKWIRRTRALTNILKLELPTPYLDGENPEYVVDIFDGADVFIRSYDVVGEEVFFYTEAQQEFDGFTLGDTVKFAVAQFSPILGKGPLGDVITVV